jgi:hypothetical protein
MNERPLVNPWRSASIVRRRLSQAALAAACLGLAACGGGSTGSEGLKAAVSAGRPRAESVSGGADVVAGRFHVRAVQSGLCLEVTGAGTTNGVNVQQSPCADVPQQWLDIVAVEGGSWRLTFAHSGRVLDVSDVSKNNGALVHQWDWVDGANQRWLARNVGSAFQLVSVNSGKCLDVRDFSLAPGGAIQQWDCGNNDNQRWTLETAVTTPPPPPPPPPATLRGASVPWTEYQAEDGQTNAQILGPSRAKWDANHIEAEAIGRKAVRLARTGDYVSIKTTAAANSIVVRYSIPDAPNGGGIDATLGLYVNGQRVRSLPLTSRYAWSYKGGLIGSPSADTPAEQPHTFFDETRLLVDAIPAGATVMLRRDAQDTAAFYVIDLVDLEQVAPPLAMPAGFTSVTQFGIQPGDGKDHGDDVLRALRSTSRLWFPPGDYKLLTISGGNVGLDNPGIEVRGAGMWYTNLRGPKAMFFCYGASVSCKFGDFSIFGEAKARDEETTGVQKAFAGPMGNGSLIENVWIEHEVGAIWVGNDPPYQTTPTQNLVIRNNRIRDTYADGINLDNGTSNSLVQNNHLRNTGDDALVVWSIQWTKWVRDMTYVHGAGFINPAAVNAPDQGQAVNNRFSNNTVQMPWRANCFAAYGGAGNVFENSVCEDVLTYPGILVDDEFSPYPFGPQTTVFRNISLIRAGGQMFNENSANPWTHGALKFYMREGGISNVLVQDVDIVDPTYAGIEFRGYGTAFVPPGERADPDALAAADNASFANVVLTNVHVTNAGTYGIQVLDNGGRGSVNFNGVTVTGSARGGLDAGSAPGAFFVKGTGNAGW